MWRFTASTKIKSKMVGIFLNFFKFLLQPLKITVIAELSIYFSLKFSGDLRESSEEKETPLVQNNGLAKGNIDLELGVINPDDKKDGIEVSTSLN